MLDGGIGGVGDAAGRAGAVEVHVPLVIGSAAFPPGIDGWERPPGGGDTPYFTILPQLQDGAGMTSERIARGGCPEGAGSIRRGSCYSWRTA